MTFTTTWTAGDGARLEADVWGEGRAVVLVHGFPHTRRLWSQVASELARSRRVITPDLRGVGASSRAESGYDGRSLAADLRSMLDHLELADADLVAIDAGVPAAFLLALEHPDRVRRLVLMEATLGALPGAEEFLSAGAPWWFGFHQVPGLAEQVLVGHEAAYLDFFYRSGTARGQGIDSMTRDGFVRAYSGTESLRCGFELYRAMPQTSRQITELVASRRLRVPTLAVGAQPVGDCLARQLAPITDNLRTASIPDCGHIIPLDRPDALNPLLDEFLS